MNRIDVIVKMRNNGDTYERIGKLLGLTRQRIYQLYKQIKPEVKRDETKCELCGREGTKKGGYILCSSCELDITRLSS